MEPSDHLLGRRIFVYSLYQYYSGSIVSGVRSHLVVAIFVIYYQLFLNYICVSVVLGPAQSIREYIT